MKKRLILIISTIILTIFLILILITIFNNRLMMYSKNMFYMDTYINIKIYSNDKQKTDKALKQANGIYKKYHSLF